MRLSAHQPDLLPYPGFFAKMARADLMDLAIFDQFQSKGYQRRVKMRGDWASLQLAGSTHGLPIKDVRLAAHASDSLIDVVRGRYRSAPFWRQRGEQVCYAIDEARSERLWMFNMSLIVAIRDMLGIRTPVSVATKPQGHGVDGLIEVCYQYGAAVYLSGDGGRAYMGDSPEAIFADSGIGLEWMNYQSPTSDSILTVLFDEEDPRKAIGL